MNYVDAEPVSDVCTQCGDNSTDVQRVGLWKTEATVDGPDDALCLPCALRNPERLQGIPHVEELLYEGEVIEIGTDGSTGAVTVQNEFGVMLITHSLSVDRGTWHDPGSGVNNAGPPARSQQYENYTVNGQGEVSVEVPRPEYGVAKTSYWKKYLQKHLQNS